MLYIIGYKGISFSSRLIKRFTLGEYSHVEWLIDLETLRGFGAFEKIGGVDYTGPHLHKRGTAYTIWALQCTERQALDFQNFSKLQIKKKYDWPGIFGFIRFKLTEDPNRWFCSELVTVACKVADIRLFNWDAVAPGHVSPNRFVMSPLLYKYKEGVTK